MKSEQRQRQRTYTLNPKAQKEYEEALAQYYRDKKAGKIKTYKSAKKLIEDITGVKL